MNAQWSRREWFGLASWLGVFAATIGLAKWETRNDVVIRGGYVRVGHVKAGDQLSLGIASVTVDGREADHCLEADDREGWAICYGTDPNDPRFADLERSPVRHVGDVRFVWHKP